MNNAVDNAAILDIRSLEFGHADAIGRLNTTIHAGEVTVISGPNGCGKSTLLSTLAGELPPLGGDVSVRREGEYVATPWQAVTRIAEPVFYPELSIRDHLHMLQRSCGRVGDLSGWEVQELLGRLPGQLSSGQRQRCYLAIQLPFISNFVAVDEPERHLDAHWQRHLKNQLRRLSRAGHGVLLATHSEELKAIADRAIDLSGQE